MKDASAELRLHLVASMAEPCRRDAFDDPLDMIVADHYRIRAMLGLASILARGRASPRVREITARALLAFLRVDLDRHLADEEAHFFPMLEQRLAPSDLLDPSLRQMAVQHASMRASAALLAEEFARVAEDPAPPPGARLRRCVAEFAQAKHRHIAIENAMVLPRARAQQEAHVPVLVLRVLLARGNGVHIEIERLQFAAGHQQIEVLHAGLLARLAQRRTVHV